MLEGKDRVRLEWVDSQGLGRGQIINNCTKITIGDGMFMVFSKENGEEIPVVGIPIMRLIRYSALKDRIGEVTSEEAGEGWESSKDSPIRDGSDSQNG